MGEVYDALVAVDKVFHELGHGLSSCSDVVEEFAEAFRRDLRVFYGVGKMRGCVVGLDVF